MLLDAADADRSAFARTFDACVVGTGPAGVTLAMRLADAGLEVALMEGGGLEFTSDSQDVYAGENVGLDYYDPDIPRLRFLGGTSNHWGGRCRPLDESDFEVRDDNPASGWPIAKSDLDPYQEETEEILNLPPSGGFPDEDLVQTGDRLRQIMWRYGEPVSRFGEKYGERLKSSERITLVVNANLVDLRLGGDLGEVTGAVFRSYDPEDAGFTIAARHYALCMGGLENPRFLLNCTRQVPTGIGNDRDMVGRYFQEHPHYIVGETVFDIQQLEVTSFSPTRALMRDRGILNFGLFMMPDVEPALSLPREIVRSVTCVAPFVERLTERVTGKDPGCKWGGIGEYIERRSTPQGMTGRVRITTEQSLSPESRVRLGEERDAFGHRRLRLDWHLDPVDYATIRTAGLVLGEHLAEQGIGRLQLREWLQPEIEEVADRDLAEVFPGVGERQGGVGGMHHMGTTRMSADPANGVVDADCRVHGIRNLYMGGSSVFASSGHANPTYTLTQLALRLGDHLIGQIGA